MHLKGKFTSAKQRLLLNVASLYQNSNCPRPTGLSGLQNKFRNAFVHVLVFLLKCFAARWLYQHSQFLPSGHLAISENSPESGKERNKNSLLLHKLFLLWAPFEFSWSTLQQEGFSGPYNISFSVMYRPISLREYLWRNFSGSCPCSEYETP